MSKVRRAVVTPAQVCPFRFAPNPNRDEVEVRYREVIDQLGLDAVDGVHVLGPSVNIVGAASMVYPAADPDTLLAGALWIATLIVNDDRWDNVGTPAYNVGQVDQALKYVGEQGTTDRPLLWNEDPFARLLAKTIEMFYRVAGPEVTAAIVYEIKRSFLGMQWERLLSPKKQDVSLYTYLAVRRFYSTMNVQVLLDRCFNGSPQLVFPLDDPIIESIDEIVCRFGALANDFYSWGREKQHLDDSNAVRLIMRAESLSEAEAIARVGELCEETIGDFQSIESATTSGASRNDTTGDIRALLDVHKPLLAAAALWPEQTSRYHV